jgi:regulator of sigma E protease
MTWVYALLGIIALIILHELGHFAVAKAVGMRVERFSLFFPPTLFKVKKGETEYAVGLIPAGGYVKITGMSPEELSRLDLRVAERAYYLQSPWKRIAVILAGPGMNILVAFVLFTAVLYAGNLDGVNTLANLNPSITTLAPTTSIEGVVRGHPADGLLLPGDRIVRVEGKRATVASTVAATASHRCPGTPKEGCRAQTPVHLTVQRHGRYVPLTIYPQYTTAEGGRMLLGIYFGAAPKEFGLLGAAWTSVRELGGTTASLLTNIGKAFTSSKVRGQLHSIVGISEVTHEAVARGVGYALVILGFVSLALAVINLFPFLPLDGGHVLWSVAEKLRGRRISLIAMWRFSSVGIVLLLFLVLNDFSNDIGRLGG